MKGLILCNGLPPARSLLKEHLSQSELFIAADGGGNTARRLDLVPDLVVGDLDSYQRQKGEKVELIKDTDQETNDLEKALEIAIKRNLTRVVVMGVTGQRIDQTLKNLSVLKRYDQHFKSLAFEDDFGTVFLLPSPFSADLPRGTTVSLFPLSGRAEGIRTSGLKYPLEDEWLENGKRDGSSNRVVSSPVEITYRTGDLLIFIGRDEHRAEF
ncbi:MAG: thiamine diphosphokinase [Balneolaceae bacterium]|nr:thiamine diphosphokinase [Balneolaceae bacterium]